MMESGKGGIPRRAGTTFGSSCQGKVGLPFAINLAEFRRILEIKV